MRAVDKLPGRSTEEIEQDLVDIFGADRRLLLVTMINELRALVKHPPLLGNKRSNKKYAKRLKAWADEGTKVYAEMPSDFPAGLLFAPPWPTDSTARILAMEEEAKIVHATFKAWLNLLRSRSAWIIDADIGEHGLAGYQQERAAIAAAEMCKLTGKTLAATSSTSDYRRAANLFYEAMTGEYNAGLERACEFAAQGRLIHERKEKSQ